MGRERYKDKNSSESEQLVSGEIREDCPCPKKNCIRHGLCGPCRLYHKKSLPYCERGSTKKH